MISEISLLPPPPHACSGWPWTEPSPILPNTMPDGSPWPRISIVTPSYNQAAYIEATIRSVLLQSYPNLEYIIIDGGSTDGSVEIIRKYEPWLAFWASERDNGQSDAINKGWSRATGSILAWLNSDDYYAPQVFPRVVNFFNQNRKTGMVYGKMAFVNPEREILDYYGRAFNLKELLISARAAVAQPSTFLRSDVVRNVGEVSPDLHISMDWDYWNRVALITHVQFVPELWSYATLVVGTKTAQMNSGVGHGPDMLKALIHFYQQKNLPPEILALKRKALAATAVRAALGYYRTNQRVKMRQTFLLALKNHPFFALRRAGRLSVRFFLG